MPVKVSSAVGTNVRWKHAPSRLRACFENGPGGETPPKLAGQRPALRSAGVLACEFGRRPAATNRKEVRKHTQSSHGRLPQSEVAACRRIDCCWAAVITPTVSQPVATFLTALT